MFSWFRRGRAPVTRMLLGINVAVFLFQILLGPKGEFLLVHFFGLSIEGLRSGFVWQIFTHMFLHGNLFHLLVNMLALWFAGQAVEIWVGARRYLLAYFIGGWVGGMLQVITFPGGNLIGASGGVCAILLMLTTLEPEMPITALLFFVLPVRVRAKFLGYGIIGVSLLLPLVGLDPHVGHFAHLGGALTGMAYALWLRRTGKYGAPLSIGGGGRAVREAAWRRQTPGGSEVERILNKVLAQGLDSLTPEERNLLEEWSRRNAA